MLILLPIVQESKNIKNNRYINSWFVGFIEKNENVYFCHLAFA